MNTREKSFKIFSTAIAAVQPALLVSKYLYIKKNTLSILGQQFLINSLPPIYIIGAGKASAAMAKIVEDILGNLVTAGIVVTKQAHSIPLQKIICLEAAHPVPDELGIDATIKTLHLLQQVRPNDIVICLISGGASSLWIDLPIDISLTDVQKTFELLLKSGATIDEVNTIRKHLSTIKGGQLIRYAPQANWYSFIISDVPGNDLSIIASGLTVPDTTTFGDAENILTKYNLHNLLPFSIAQHIDKGCKGMISETPLKNDPIFLQVHNKVIGNNNMALQAAALTARQLGYCISFINKNMEGDAAIVGRKLVSLCKEYAGIKPTCFLLGGETTVTVKGKGKGGRNQQMALSALLQLAAYPHNDHQNKITFLAAGTDGTDGPTDAAGAIADNNTLTIMKEKKLDPQAFFNNNDAYHFFEQTGGLLKTGATQTNVMDLVIIFVE